MGRSTLYHLPVREDPPAPPAPTRDQILKMTFRDLGDEWVRIGTFKNQASAYQARLYVERYAAKRNRKVDTAAGTNGGLYIRLAQELVAA